MFSLKQLQSECVIMRRRTIEKLIALLLPSVPFLHLSFFLLLQVAEYFLQVACYDSSMQFLPLNILDIGTSTRRN